MDDFLILLQTQLDEAALKGVKGNLEQLRKDFEELKLKPVLDQQALSNIVKQLENITGKKITIPNIEFNSGQAIKDAQKTAQQIVNASTSATDKVIQNERKKQQAYRETAEVQKQIAKDESIIKSSANVTTFKNTNNAARDAADHFAKLLENENAVISVSEKFGKTNGLSSFTINVKRATGEVESLRYALESIKGKDGNPTGDYIFKNTNAELNNANAIKQVKAVENAFANFTQKIEQFKSTNSWKLSGLTAPLSDFENKLTGLKSGANTIDEVRNAFKLLQAEASKIDAPLKRQLSTFDSYKNAVDKGKESISGYRAELKGLTNAPKELSQELTKAGKLLLQINRTEATEGTTANWSNQAREFVDSLTNIGNKINVIKKEQANSASTQVFNTKDLDAQGRIYIQKINNTIEKTKSEIENKLRNAGYMDIEIKGIEEANGKIKSLTVNVTDAAGAFKQLNFERAKIQNGGKAQAGLIQTDDVKVIGNISSAIQTVQDNLSSLKAKWEEQGILVGDFKSKIEQLEVSISTVGSKGELNGLKTQIDNLKNEASAIAQINKIQLSMDTGGYESKVESLIAKTRQWTNAEGEARISTDALSAAFDNLKKASDNYANSPTEANQKRLIATEKELDTQLKTVTNSVRKMNTELAKDSTISSLHNKVVDFMSKNGKTVKYYGTELRDILRKTEQGASLTDAQVRQLNQDFNNVVITARNAGKLGKTFFRTLRDGMGAFSYWTSSTFLVMKAIQSVKGGISTVKGLDTALVDLKKTTTMTASELEDFYYASNKVAKQMGVTTKEILEQAAAWSRLGFSTAEQATKMAQLSSKFASISPGMSTDEAQEGLVSIIKAWGLNVDEVEREVLDNINTLGNKFAESNADLVAGMKRSAAALAATGTTYQDAFALFTGAQEVVQNAEIAGRALRSVTMRIHGYSENSEDGLMEVDEELKNITGDLIDLTKTAEHSQGVSIFKEGSSTEFKSLVNYFGEIHTIWNEMSQVQQNAFLDKAFGKNQAQAGAAIIQNYEAIANAMKAMEDAGGSAEREMSIIMDSLDYKVNRLSETSTSVAQNLFKREDMKTVVDGLTSVMNVIDKLTSKIGLFGSIGLGAGLFAGFKNIGEPI